MRHTTRKAAVAGGLLTALLMLGGCGSGGSQANQMGSQTAQPTGQVQQSTESTMGQSGAKDQQNGTKTGDTSGTTSN
ncbi:MAG: hypothetical protein WB783_12485 [Arenicellales bacterium]